MVKTQGVLKKGIGHEKKTAQGGTRDRAGGLHCENNLAETLKLILHHNKLKNVCLTDTYQP